MEHDVAALLGIAQDLADSGDRRLDLIDIWLASDSPEVADLAWMFLRAPSVLMSLQHNA